MIKLQQGFKILCRSPPKGIQFGPRIYFL